MKKILIAVVVLAPVFCWAQGAGRAADAGRATDAFRAADAARWAKARDFLSSQLALEAIRGKARTDSGVRARFAQVRPVLEAVTIESPPSSVALDEMLRDFARVRLVVVDPLSHIDLRRFSTMPDGGRRLVDTAFEIVGRGYAIDGAMKTAIGSRVTNFLASGAGATAGAGGSGLAGGSRAAAGSGAVAAGSGAADSTGKAASGVKPVIALGGQPSDTSPAASHGRGFDLWVLLPILLLAAVCLVIWRKYQDIEEELRARKVEMRSFNENYFKAARSSGPGGSAGGSGSSGSSGSGGSSGGADRKAMERAIADSNVIAELNLAIGKLQLRISQLEGKTAGSGTGSTSAGGVGSTAGSGSGSISGATGPVAAMTMKEKNKLRVAEPAKPTEDPDVFYMAGPVNNYFPNSAKSTTKDNTVYRFKVSSNKQDAEFELHTSGAPINEIVQLAESYIKAACDEENLPPYPVKNIITKKAGQAILEGDKWIIKSKALIRYE